MAWWSPKKWFTKAAPQGAEGPLKLRESSPEPFVSRRYDAAQTTRFNRAHWQHAHGQSVNNDLATDLDYLQARAAYEIANNPILEGVVKTYCDDVIGRDGPTLQVIPNDPNEPGAKEFATIVEREWRKVWAMPDPTGRIGGVEGAKLWVRMLLGAGSFLNIISNVRRSDSRVKLGWKVVHPRRLVTPPDKAGNPRFAFGQELDPEGKPIAYYIADPQQSFPIGGYALTGRRYSADQVQHGFIAVEPEQITGAPMLAPSLETAADIREYDASVMQAAKNAADHAIGLQATASAEAMLNPDPIPAGGVKVERGMVNVAPKGWQFSAFAATQPAAQYVEFRHERLSELGRPLHMPLIIVLLSTAGANFASAQFEGTIYANGIAALQGYLERRHLVPLIEMLITELAILGAIRKPKSGYTLQLTWNVPPHANIEKFVKAVVTMVEAGIITPADACGMLGRDWEKVVSGRARCAKDLEAAGLPPAPVYSGSGTKQPEESGDEGESTPAPTAATQPKSNQPKNGRRTVTA